MLFKRRFFCLVIIGLFLCPFFLGSIFANQIQKEEVYMKVAFYTFDEKIKNRGRFLGFAELEHGELKIDVSDPELEKFLECDFTTIGGKAKEEISENGRKFIMGGIIVYKSGTPEHLRGMAEKVKDFGYIGKIVNKQE